MTRSLTMVRAVSPSRCAVVLLAACLSFPAASFAADGIRLGAGTVRFASVEEGRAVLGSDDAWIEATSDFQRAATLGVPPPVSMAQLRTFSAKAVRPWPDDQAARWRRALETIAPRFAALHLPVPAEVLLIDTDGSVKNCGIAVTSGDVGLDSAACAAITKRGRYKPALDKDGKPIAVHSTRRVVWRL